jgi:hypothetical protein
MDLDFLNLSETDVQQAVDFIGFHGVNIAEIDIPTNDGVDLNGSGMVVPDGMHISYLIN